METTVFPTKPLYRPEQTENAKSEIKALEEKLTNKHIEDKAEVARQLRRARKDFESQIPKAPETTDEEDRMVKRAKMLLEEIRQGMLSQAEMRRNPPGAVEAHRAWEGRNKSRILEWKHIMLRLNAGSGDRDAANLEKHRPTASTMNLDGAQIPGKQIYLPENPDGLGVTFSDAQLALIEQLDPAMREQLASLSNRQRTKVKEIVGIGLEPKNPVKAKRTMSEAQKANLAKGRAAAKAKRDAKKAEKAS